MNKIWQSATGISMMVSGICWIQSQSAIGQDATSTTPSGVLKMVKDLRTGWEDSYPYNLTEVNGELVFVASVRSWVYELCLGDMPEGDILAKEIKAGDGTSYSYFRAKINGRLLLVANDPIHGNELWATDGTLAGTYLVKDINPGSAGSDTEQWIVYRGLMFFAARNAANGIELWRSDGTEAGTVLIKDINPGFSNSYLDKFVIVNDHLVFLATDPTRGEELWTTDGTDAGTFCLKDISPGVSSPRCRYVAVAGNRLFFTVTGNKYISGGLWASDGTESGTYLLKEVGLNAASYKSVAANDSGVLFFYADDTARNEISHGSELWKSDGTPNGTVLVKDMTPGPDSTDFFFSGLQLAETAVLNGRVIFTANAGKGTGMNPVYGREIWSTDGTEAGTSLLKDIYPGAGSVSSKFLCIENNRLLFLADDYVHGGELWSTDGTPQGTSLLKDINLGQSSSDILVLTNVNGWLYFTAYDPVNMRSLWKSDGTEAGTQLLKSHMVFPSSLVTPVFYDSRLYFVGGTATTGNELCVTDGTEAGTQVVGEIREGSSSGISRGSLFVLDNAIYFSGKDGIHGEELWTYQPPVRRVQVWLSKPQNIGLGRVQFGIECTTKGAITIQRSIDLQNWITVAQVSLTDPSQPVIWSDITPTQSPSWFYRGLYQPQSSKSPVIDSQRLVWINPGAFTMGSPDDESGRDSDEGPQTQVTISRGYWMGRYEVTQREYQSVMDLNPSYFKGDTLPVEQVTWYEATNYCAKLTDNERSAGRLPAGYVYRLPTEAEWEYACRAGTTTATVFGDSLSSTQANFDGKYPYNGAVEGPNLDRTANVGSYAPNAWGLYDMHGNVWEWCLDWYKSSLSGGSVNDPQGPSSGSYRVNRAGSWNFGGRFCRSSHRGGNSPWNSLNYVGFRVVLAPEL